MEKICLISPQVGRDKISDFTTHFAKRYLLSYTENFARKYIAADRCKNVCIEKVFFNYTTKTWHPGTFYLPFFDNDYVIITPKTILTREETFISRKDFFLNLEQISPSETDSALRFALENYFASILSKEKENRPTNKEKERMALELLHSYPVLADYYLRYKEEHGDDAIAVSEEAVGLTEMLFNKQLRLLIDTLEEKTDFYTKGFPDSHIEAMERVLYLKHAIEDQDCYRLFYIKGQPLRRETDLQIMYRLLWYASEVDVNREVNNGRGPVDFKVSYGARDATLVEFKLASNKSLKKNLQNQVKIYETANNTDKSIKVILFFTELELKNVIAILKDLKLDKDPNIILIDARSDNKPSASVA